MIENVDGGDLDDETCGHNDDDHETMHEFGVTDPSKIKLAQCLRSLCYEGSIIFVSIIFIIILLITLIVEDTSNNDLETDLQELLEILQPIQPILLCFYLVDILLNLFTFSRTYIAELKLIGIMELLAILVCFIVSILSLQ